MVGLSKEEIMMMLEKVELRESEKRIIAEILLLNNIRIEEQLACIINLVIDERERNVSKVTYFN